MAQRSSELHRSAHREEVLAGEDGFVAGVLAAIALLRAERYLDAADLLERAQIVERPKGEASGK